MYTYKMPTELFFGKGTSTKVGEKVLELGGSKVLLVADKGVLSAGILKGIQDSLEGVNIPYVVFSDIESDPSITSIEKGTEVLKAEGCDIVIGIGGGSSMDSAKAIAVMATNPGKIQDYVGLNLVKVKPLPIIAIPTTAGTGSEATYWSVLRDTEAKVKVSVGGWLVMPTLAIVDPVLTRSLPPRVTAFTGMDALTHALESYVCTNTQPISEGMSIQAMKMIAKSLRKAVANGDDLDAREDMITGSLVAALAFNVTRLGLAHALAIPFGATFGIPHGMINAILLPHVMEYNLMGATEKFIEIARIFGENVENMPKMEAAYKSVEAVKKLMKDIGIVEGLEDYGVKEEDLRAIAEEGYKSGNVLVNPRKATVEDLINISRKAMKGLKD